MIWIPITWIAPVKAPVDLLVLRVDPSTVVRARACVATGCAPDDVSTAETVDGEADGASGTNAGEAECDLELADCASLAWGCHFFGLDGWVVAVFVLALKYRDGCGVELLEELK